MRFTGGVFWRRPKRLVVILSLLLTAYGASTLSGGGNVLAQTSETGSIPAGTEIDRIPTRQKVVALTFDDAWRDESLLRILDILREAGIKGTFFPTGRGVEKSPELARRIVAEGHELGSHGYKHDKLWMMTREEIVAGLQKTEEAFSAAGLSGPGLLLRAPYGEVSPRVLNVLGEEGCVHIGWTARGGDSVANRSVAQVVAYIMADVRPGAIILLHTNNDLAPRALSELIRRLKAKGYTFVTVGEALFSAEQMTPRYQETSPYLTYVGDWQKVDFAAASGGSIHQTNVAGAMAVVSFTGTSLELIAQTGPGRGMMRVSVDGTVARDTDLYSPEVQQRATVFSLPSLADGDHLVVVSCLGTKNVASTGHLVDIDAVRVSGALTQAPIIPTLTRGWDILRLVASAPALYSAALPSL